MLENTIQIPIDSASISCWIVENLEEKISGFLVELGLEILLRNVLFELSELYMIRWVDEKIK